MTMQLIDRVMIFTLLLQVLSPMTLGSECKCGVPATVVSTRIKGGMEVAPHSHPWLVAIRHVDPDVAFCGGTVITNMHVLTAAHCFYEMQITDMDVLLGIHDINDLANVEVRNIQEAAIHDSFDYDNVKNDICMVTLVSPVVFGDTIVPICMPSPAQDFSGRTATVLGWGDSVGESYPSNVLLKADLNILSSEECRQSIFGDYYNPSSMLCAFAEEKNNCQGDSGGPLLVFEPSGRYVEAGIISYGENCDYEAQPALFTNVAFFLDWIRDHTQNAETCY